MESRTRKGKSGSGGRNRKEHAPVSGPNCKTPSSFVGLFRLQYEFCSFCLSTFYKTYGSCFTKSRVFWFVLLIHMFYGYIVS
jgi:hypothetical protein